MTTVTEDAVYKGKSLHVAEFLSTFQGFFRRNDAERKGPVTVEMLERALKFRQQLINHYNLENKLAIFRKDETLTDIQLAEMEQSVQESKSSIESVPANVKAVNELLRRFEVWSTKALANEVLTHCIKDKDNKVTSCCSPLLNMHGAAAFLPAADPNSGDSQDHVCGLSAPANAWTWEEYLRLCEMVSLLQDPKEAMTSTLTVASPSLIGPRKEELKLTESHVLTPADLVALWTRAQRNTSALLHLMDLFQVTEAPDDPREERYSIKASAASRGKMLVVDADDEDSDEEEEYEPPRYIAEYVGNHKLTRKHVLKCSPLVDKVVEWAVTNQALFTYKYIRENMPERMGIKKAGKKRRLPVDGSTEESSAKRRRTIRCKNDEEELKLRQACDSYVLRLFGRRNRKVLSLLFTSEENLKYIDLYPYESIVEQLLKRNVSRKIRRVLKKDHHDNSSRTLARVDRRLHCPYYDGGEIDLTYRQVVVKLLKALAECAPPEILSESEVLAACEDFETLYDKFIGDKSASEAAESLLDMGVDFEESPADLLGSFTEPWNTLCSICRQSFDEDDAVAEILSCANCSKRYHSSCPGSDERSLSDLLKGYSPLAQLVAAVPDDMKPTDMENVKIWRCATCQEVSASRSKENRIFTEAKWCKALIRDIGMESYSLPFHDENEVDTQGENSRCISLRRLDSMMDYIILKHDPSLTETMRKQQLNSVRSPFLLPPSIELSSPEPLEWVTESIISKPMELLCKGVEIMVAPSDAISNQWKFDRTAFFRSFLHRFGAWFLCSREEGTGLPLQPSGNLSHMLVARTPWSEDSCIVCRSRPVESSDSSAPVCDNIACKQLHVSGDIHGKGVEATAETACGESSPSPVDAFSSYDDLSSLVGSPLLVLPGDPMLQFVSEDIGTSVNHMDRPMFFIVASYLPRQFSKADKLAGQVDDEGIFHLFPVIEPRQLTYLLSFLTTMRRPPPSYVDSDSWTYLRVMDLEGVVRMSSDEVRQKLKETIAIRNAVNCALGDIVRTDGKASETKDSAIQDTAFVAQTNATSDLVGKYSVLIDSLLSSQNTLIRDMVDSLRPSTAGEDDDDGDDVLDFSNIVDDFQVDVDELESGDVPGSAQHPLFLSDTPTDVPNVSANPTRDHSNIDSSPLMSERPRNQQPVMEENAAPRNQNMEPLALNALPQYPGAVQGGQPIPGPRASMPGPAFHHQQFVAPVVQPHNQYPVAPPNRNVWQPTLQQNPPDTVNPDRNPYERVIGMRDLYQPGLAIFSRVETALYLEACRRSMPSLGLRLLCPRYSLDMSREHIRKVFGCDQSRIPKVQEALWSFIVGNDYTRARTETGRYVLEDIMSDQTYKYNLPTMILPLDRLTESFLKKEAGLDVVDLTNGDDTNGSQINPSHQNQAFEPPVNRIRGGGPSDEGLFEIQPDRDDEPDAQMRPAVDQGNGAAQPNGDGVAAGAQPEIVDEPTALIDTPRNEWQDRLVCIRVATTIYGESREEAVSIGVVQRVDDQNESDNVPVSLFYFSNAGYLRNETVQRLPAAQLLIVEEGSSEYRTAQGWDGFARLPIARRVSPDEQIGVADTYDGENEDNEAAASADDTSTPPTPRRPTASRQNAANEEMEDETVRSVEAPSDNRDKQGRQQQDAMGESLGDNLISLLTDTPKESWANRIVFTKCKVKLGDDLQEAVTIGVVRSALGTNEIGEDQVLVDLIYFSNRGHLPGPLTHEMSADTLQVCMEGSTEYEIARKFEGFEELLGTSPQDESSVPSDASTRRGSDAGFLPEPTSGSTNPTFMKDIGNLLAKDLCQRQHGPSPIGHLPDGRAVIWAQSDPRALYVEMVALDKRGSSSADRRQLESTSCPWGCGVGKGRSISEDAIQDHLLSRHDFGLLDDSVVAIDGVGRLFRLPEGQMISTLSAQLVTAICSDSPELSDFTDRSSRVFCLERILDREGSLRKRVVDKLEAHDAARSLLQLWVRIAKLFHVESTGLFRLDVDNCETLLYVGNKEVPARIVDDIAAGTSPEQESGCLNGEKNVASADESTKCGLCGPRLDSSIRLHGDDTTGGEETEAAKIGGSACGLLSRLCKSSLGDFERRAVLLESSGPDGVARSMLLALAENVPNELRQVGVSNSSMVAPDASMFDDGNYQAWRYLVGRGQTVGSILQAFVILIGSLKISKLPRWWTGAREGWTSPFATMSSASYGYSALFVRLYALDLAIAEFLLPSKATAEDTAPLVLRRLSSVEERIRMVHEWAKSLNYSRYEGVHESECTLCKDGGRLLVCGYCKTSQHPHCCVPVIVDDSKFDHWVCPKCVTDIAVLVGEDDDDDSQAR